MTDPQIAWSLGIGFVMLSAPIVWDVLRHRKQQRASTEKLKHKLEEHEASRRLKEKEEAEEAKCLERLTLVAEKQNDDTLEMISKPFHAAAYVDAFVIHCCSQCPEMATCEKQVTVVARNVARRVQNSRKERLHKERVKEILAKLK